MQNSPKPLHKAEAKLRSETIALHKRLSLGVTHLIMHEVIRSSANVKLIITAASTLCPRADSLL